MTSGIIQILIGDTNVQTAVGTYVNAGETKYKVFPVVAAQKTVEPWVAVQKRGNEPFITKDCFSRLDISVYETRVWSKKGFRETEMIHEVCRRALETGVRVITDSCTFQRIWLTNDYDHFDEDQQMYCHVGLYTAQVERA